MEYAIGAATGIGLCAMIFAFLSVAASVGLSRSGVGDDAGLAGRYITILSPLLCVIYVAWLVYGPTVARLTVHTALFVLVCAGIPAQLQSAHKLDALVVPHPSGSSTASGIAYRLKG